MMEMLNEYIIEQALIVIPVLLILGKIIKETDVIKDKYIPLTLLFVGVIFAITLIGFNVDAVIQGILVAGAAVFGHELYKQSKEYD